MPPIKRKPSSPPYPYLRARTRDLAHLPVPGRVAGRGAVIPVHLRCTDKGVVPADPLVFAGTASVLEGPREPPARPRSPRALPCQVSPVAIKIGDDAVAAPFAFFVIESMSAQLGHFTP